MRLIAQIWVGLAVLATLGACGNPAPFKPPTPAAKVSKVGYESSVLVMQIDLGANEERSGILIDRAADEVAKIGQEIISGRPPVAGIIDRIDFVVIGPVGRDAANGRRIATFTIDGPELQHLARTGATAGTVLAAARDFKWSEKANTDIIRDYCSVPRPAAFCRRFG